MPLRHFDLADPENRRILTEATNNPTPENCLRWWQMVTTDKPVHPTVPEASVHKARLCMARLTAEEHKYSLEWLKTHGYKPFDKTVWETVNAPLNNGLPRSD